MKAFLVRHEEALKNVAVSFAASVESDADTLTASGHDGAVRLGEELRDLQADGVARIGRVICSSSLRALGTAEILGRVLQRPVIAVGALRSISSGVLAGRSEDEAWESHPAYMRALTLFRAGLFNSYGIPEFEGKEGKRDFEQRVISAFRWALAAADSDLVIVSQRSPITAILIHCARTAYGYPDDFFGHVQLDLGRVSLVSIEGDSVEIVAVNSRPKDLKKSLQRARR